MADDQERVWDLIARIPVCMLAVWDGKELKARPLHPYVQREEDAVYFLVDARSRADDEVREYDNVALSFADRSGQIYVSVSGHARVEYNPAKIRELWSIGAKAWWDSPEDSNIRLLRVTPVGAEYWSGPGKLVSMIKMATAAVTGNRPDMGEVRKVSM